VRRLRVNPAILERFPGYTAAVVYARDLENGESDAEGAAGIREAEDFVRANLKEPASAHPHLHAWRNAFSAFGVKPSKFLCSAEALVKRVLKGEELPAINRVVDAYNAVSLRHVVPAGGEDLDRLESDLELTFSDGTERRHARASGRRRSGLEGLRRRHVPPVELAAVPADAAPARNEERLFRHRPHGAVSARGARPRRRRPHRAIAADLSRLRPGARDVRELAVIPRRR
jgi:hypothetical protein